MQRGWSTKKQRVIKESDPTTSSPTHEHSKQEDVVGKMPPHGCSRNIRNLGHVCASGPLSANALFSFSLNLDCSVSADGGTLKT
eukprot:4377178-Amphidinium_carterae.1